MSKKKAVIGYLWRIKDGLIVAQRRWRYRKQPSSKHIAAKEGFEEVEVYEPGRGEAEGGPTNYTGEGETMPRRSRERAQWGPREVARSSKGPRASRRSRAKLRGRLKRRFKLTRRELGAIGAGHLEAPPGYRNALAVALELDRFQRMV